MKRFVEALAVEIPAAVKKTGYLPRFFLPVTGTFAAYRIRARRFKNSIFSIILS